MHERDGTVEYTVTLPISNARSVSLTLILEPWGDEYTVSPGVVFEVVARGPVGGSLHVEAGEDYIAVYAWSGSVITLFHDGVSIGGSDRPPVPPVPAGASVQDFLHAMFG